MGDWDNPNNDNDSWYSELNLEDANNTKNEKDDDIKPVKIGKGGVVVICIIFFSVIFIFSILSVGWFSGGKSNKKSTDGVPINITGEGTTETSKNYANSEISSGISASGNISPEENVNHTEEIKINEDADSEKSSDSAKNDVSKPLENGASNSTINSGINLSPVREPVFSESGSAVAKIVSKDIFESGISYVYSVKIAFAGVSEGSAYSGVRYFCPRKTFDALSLGDEVNVEYDLDESGIISIVSMSK